jgi:hypothetical protein
MHVALFLRRKRPLCCCVNSDLAWTFWRSNRTLADGGKPSSETWVVQPTAQSLYWLFNWKPNHCTDCAERLPIQHGVFPEQLFPRFIFKTAWFSSDLCETIYRGQESEKFRLAVLLWIVVCDTYRNLWYVWFNYSRGSKQSSLLRMNEVEMKPPYATNI